MMVRIFFLILLLANCSFGSEVDEILADANIHDPRGAVKALVKLGKPAVPLLIARLNTYKHPALILEALGRIGDPTAVLPVVEFTRKQDRTKNKDILSIKAGLKALADLADPRPEMVVLEILRNEKNVPAIRLYAATTLTKIGSDQSRAEASDFILNSPVIASGKISPIDLDTAYFELGTKEAMQRLTQAIKSASGYEQLFIVDLLAERNTTDVNEILFQVSENKQYFPETRLRAVETLVRRKNRSKERLLNALQSLREDVPATEDPGFLVTQKNVDYLIKKVQRE